MPGMHLLASIDLVLYVALFFAVWWAFGARVLCVALVFFGCQFPANGFFTGGAFLRQDWLFAVVVSACLARRRKLVAAGFLLVLAAMEEGEDGTLFFGDCCYCVDAGHNRVCLRTTAVCRGLPAGL